MRAQYEELDTIYAKIDTWHKRSLKKYRAELPKYEFDITRKRYQAFMKRVDACYNEGDLRALHYSWKETAFFVLPWEAIIWYSMQPKKKKN